MRTRHICILCTTCTFIHMTVFNVLLKYYVQCLGNIVWGVQWHTQHLFYMYMYRFFLATLSEEQ